MSTSPAGPIRVVVAGPEGRMGRVMMRGLPAHAGIKVVGGFGRGDGDATVSRLFAEADVMVDFTHLDSAPALMAWAIEAGVRPVSGTSGLSDDVLSTVDEAARRSGIGAVWAANFRLGGALLKHIALIAARHLDSVEIIEAHHATKADAPSGTAKHLAETMRAARGSDFVDPVVEKETIAGTRGGAYGGVRVHSLRQPDILGWHEVVFAGDQEQLSIRHTETGRDGFVGPVAAAVRLVMEPGVVGLVRGYEAVLGLTDLDR